MQCPLPLRRIVVTRSRQRADDCAVDQSLRVCGQHHRGDLQRPLADRDVLQGAQAEPEDQDLRGNHRKRPLHPDLDSIDRHAADQVPAVQGRNPLVVIEFGGLPALESLYLPQFMGVVGPAGRYPAP